MSQTRFINPQALCKSTGYTHVGADEATRLHRTARQRGRVAAVSAPQQAERSQKRS